MVKKIKDKSHQIHEPTDKSVEIVNNTKIKFRYKHPVIFWLFMTCLIIGTAGITATSVYVGRVLKTVPAVTQKELKSDASSNMYASDNTLIWSSAKNKRVYVKYKDIPKKYVDMLLATEDRTFYKDNGFSPKGLANAGLSYVKEKLGKGESRGGSSIEQQLIKLSVFSTNVKDRNINRKIKELFLAQQLYENYSKNQILEFYVNKIAVGEGAYGIQTISNVYFNKDLKDLTLSQLAIIAGLGQAPSYYNLYDRPKAVEKRRDQVLYAAYSTGKITKREYKDALKQNIDAGLQPRHWMETKVNKQTLDNDGFVTSALAQVKNLGYQIDKTPLQITTTLDLNLNQQLKSIIDRDYYYQGPEHQVAVTVVDPKTGFVIAQNGGRHITQIHSLNRAINTSRSSGSGIKPFVDYGPAIEYYNWASNRLVDTSNYQYPGTNVIAHNFGNEVVGWTTMRQALWMSYNTPAIRTLDAVGGAQAKKFLNNVGFNMQAAPAGSQAIGIDASTSQMASAFASLSNGGIYKPTQYIKSLKFADSSTKEIKLKEVRAMKASTAFILAHILQGVPTKNGTIPDAAIPGLNQGIKTGTVAYPDDAWNMPDEAIMDAWVNGFTKGISVSLWQGYDQPMKDGHYITQNTASQKNNTLYKDIMKLVSKGRDNSQFTPPSTVRSVGGRGLSEDFIPLDKVDTLLLNAPDEIITHQDLYDRFLTKKVLKSKKAKREDKNYNKMPKDYKIGDWKNKYDSDGNLKADKKEEVTNGQQGQN